MRIAQVCWLNEAVPPKLYGGTERVVSFLTETLVEMGHDVTLFASGDSVTSGKLEAVWPRALRLDPTVRDWVAPHMLMFERVRQMADQFDVLHFHQDYWTFSLFSRQPTPFVTTMHGRLDLPELQPIYDNFNTAPLVSIFDAQRRPLPQANFLRTIYHGLPENLLTPQPIAPSYLAFLGRLCPEKAPDRAIRMAREFGMKLKIPAKVDNADIEYYENQIKPLIDGNDVEMIGEINDAQKPDFLSGAHALLTPMEFPEPFGLVMIEAMACGTPVIAYRRGSVPEIVEEGVTGYVIDSEAEGVAALRRMHEISRATVRRRFEQRFTARRMAQDYLSLYQSLGQNKKPALRAIG